MRSRPGALVFAVVSSLVLSLTLSADSPVPPPVHYGPPDDAASRVPPPAGSFLPAEPGARKEVLENLSTSLLPPFPSTKPPVAAQVGSETEVAGRSKRWSFETEAVIVDPVTTVATDSRGVEEPVIINLVKLGATHTLTGFIRRIQEDPGVAFQVRNEWSYRSTAGPTSGGLMPLPAGYTDSADPVLAHNGTTGGIAPERTYMAGLALNRGGPPNFPGANPTSIRVWISVNGGSSWTSSGSEVDVIASSTTSTLDKPWIAVSETGSTTGFVYVAWVRFDTSGAGLNELMFRRSRNGISKAHAVCCYPPTWDSSVRITELGRVQGPQIVIDNSGFVYIIFVDSGTRQMRITRSRFAGANVPSDGSTVFLPAQTIATYNRVNTSSLTNYIFGGRTRAVPLPAARYNASTNEILVSWHDGETDTAATVDVRLFRVTANATMAATPVSLGSAINSAGVNQFTPVVETDGTGTVVLAYYDARGLAANTYQQRVAKFSSTGALLSPVPPDTNPTALGPPCAADFVGEYQGLWRGSYPGGFRYDVAWTCGSSSTDRTILRAGVQ